MFKQSPLCAFLASLCCVLGCGEDITGDAVAPSTQAQPLTIPGPWSPPASTRQIAQTQYVPVVDPPAVSPVGRCTSNNAFACSCTHPACTPAQSGTVKLDTYLRQRFPFLGYGGLFCCRQNSATTSVPKLSVHAIGRAIDLMITLENNDANNGKGDQVANWLVENAKFIGVQRVIWDKAYWNGERGFGLLSSSSLSHTNHIHVELSIAGAAAQTPFFTSGAYTGTCTTRCEGDRLIKADCSSVDCAATQTKCLPGAAPKCSDPPPPEPPKAVAVANAPLPRVAAAGPLARHALISPVRLFDTRTPAASASLRRGNGGLTGPVSAGAPNLYTPTNNIPADATGVWLNVAAVPLQLPGFISLSPAGQPVPETSSLNYTPGFVRANAAPISFGAGRGVAFHAHADVNLIADAMSALAPTGAGLVTTTPKRVLDTRSSNTPLLDDQIREIDVQAPAGATGVIATVVVIQGKEQGFLQAFACGSTPSETSNINYGQGDVVANTVISPIGAGKLCVRALKEAHLVVDVTGYLAPNAPLSFQALTPKRLLDTRQTTSLFKNRMGERQVLKLPIQSLPGMPQGLWAVAVNLTSVGASGPGFVAAYPCNSTVPATSSLNFSEDGAIGALAVSSLSEDGSLCVFASSRTHLIVDVIGAWVHDAAVMPPKPDDTKDPADEGDPDGPEDPTSMEDMSGSLDMMSAMTDMSASLNDMAQGQPDGGVSGADSGTSKPKPKTTSASSGCQSTPAGSPLGIVWLLMGLCVMVGRRVRLKRAAAD